MHLSFLTCPGLSGGAVVCSARGLVLGYIAGGVQVYSEEDYPENPNQHYATFAYMMHGLPRILGNKK